jgi:alkylation response protein AidB-like acyl-CoA dehydrogenase
MGNRVGWEVAQGMTKPDLAGAVKVFGTEGMIKVMRLLLDVLGAAGLVRAGSPGAVLKGRIEREYRLCQINTFGGGTAEVLRDMVAQFGLGLPRAAR